MFPSAIIAAERSLFAYDIGSCELHVVNLFNNKPYVAGKARWKDFGGRVLDGLESKISTLEFGIVENISGVLKW